MNLCAAIVMLSLSQMAPGESTTASVVFLDRCPSVKPVACRVSAFHMPAAVYAECAAGERVVYRGLITVGLET